MENTHKSTLAMELRKKAGLTQRQVAESLGVTVTTVARWERGESVPLIYLDQVKSLLQLYQCSIEDLVQAFASRHTINQNNKPTDNKRNSEELIAS